MIKCIGLASGIGAGNVLCAKGPLFLKDNLIIQPGLIWHTITVPKDNITDKYDHISILNQSHSAASHQLTKETPFFLSFGGDHSSAIGTWSGIAEAKAADGDIGLIWIDAHMDSHTPQTSESGNIHGMPLAALLGYGDERLTKISSSKPKIKPENCALVGIRSYEPQEAEFLKKLNVKVYFTEEVQQRGLRAILEEILEDFSKRTIGYGVSFDLDAIDPSVVKAVGTPVPCGIDADEAIHAMSFFSKKPPLAFELVEYNPEMDTDGSTLKFTQKLLQNLINNVSVAL
jgi:arginase